MTSRSRIAAPVLFRCESLVSALRPVAITLSPRARISWTKASPKPDEQPVTSQTDGDMSLGLVFRIWEEKDDGERGWSSRSGLKAGVSGVIREVWYDDKVQMYGYRDAGVQLV